jgi:hypothetical protein
MCLSYLFEKISKRRSQESSSGYVELQNVVCGPVTFRVVRSCYFRRSEKSLVEKDYTELTLCKDRILFNDSDHVKYDYLATFYRVSDTCVIINTFTNLDMHTNSIFADDSITGVCIVFDRPIAARFLKTLYGYLETYKRYDTYDKTVKNYISFRQMFRRKRRPQTS